MYSKSFFNRKQVLSNNSNDFPLTTQIHTWAQQSIIQLKKKKEEAQKIDELHVNNIKNKIDNITNDISYHLRKKRTLKDSS